MKWRWTKWHYSKTVVGYSFFYFMNMSLVCFVCWDVILLFFFFLIITLYRFSFDLFCCLFLCYSFSEFLGGMIQGSFYNFCCFLVVCKKYGHLFIGYLDISWLFSPPPFHLDFSLFCLFHPPTWRRFHCLYRLASVLGCVWKGSSGWLSFEYCRLPPLILILGGAHAIYLFFSLKMVSTEKKRLGYRIPILSRRGSTAVQKSTSQDSGDSCFPLWSMAQVWRRISGYFRDSVFNSWKEDYYRKAP